MSKFFGSSVAACLLVAGFGFVATNRATAQGQPGTTPPPKILVIQNEALKPGHGGSLHQGTESAFVRAFQAAKWPTYYLGMDALSGKSRAAFFLRYDSLDAWQKDTDAQMKDPTLSAAIDSSAIADGAHLEGFEQSVFAYREDLSLSAPVKIEDMRFMEVLIFEIKPGHRKDWDDLVKMYIKAYDKIPGSHWATFEKLYGTNSGSRFIAITPLKSLAEADQEMLNDKSFVTAMGAEGLKKLEDLSAAAIVSSESHLYAINPKISYEPDSWATASPDFWGKK